MGDTVDNDGPQFLKYGLELVHGNGQQGVHSASVLLDYGTSRDDVCDLLVEVETSQSAMESWLASNASSVKGWYDQQTTAQKAKQYEGLLEVMNIAKRLKARGDI